MSKTLSILLAEPTKVTFGDCEISVAEIDWGHLLDFATRLSGVMGSFLQVDAAGKATVSLDLGKLGAIIGSSSALATELLVSTTNLTADKIAKLPARVVLILIDEALKVNFTEEFLAAGKAVAARLTAALGGPETSAASSKA